MKPYYFNVWKNAKGGQTFNYDGAGAGTKNGSNAHYDPKTGVLVITIREKSIEPVDYKSSTRKLKTRIRELYGNPKKYIFILDECYTLKGFNYKVEFYYKTDSVPSVDTMLKAREIVKDIDNEDMEVYLERKHQEKILESRKRRFDEKIHKV